MFDTVLVANRGAIATRIIRSLDSMGVRSVAVYAEGDRDSLHVANASEAIGLGNGGAQQTYLDAARLLEIAERTGAQAIHPGYGFLSENAAFVRQCEARGITFIGPTARQIEQFGQKHVARELALAAGVPMSAGSGLLSDIEAALQSAGSVGYPVMLKSTAGGGGIGMQLCEDAPALRQAFTRVRHQGASHFANDGVFLEKAIARARHIEVQVFGDGAGNALAIGERDCSSQRRNQKVVEECPAMHLDEGVRALLHRTAETLLARANYRNAGTVEFIIDADNGEFVFLEVNTRLQVEHGVTEAVYGIDLVQWMVQQAAGELPPLDVLQQALQPSGHAIQVRLYAEDPWRAFQPSAGTLSSIRFPEHDTLRIDHWLTPGIEVTPDFDPLLGKLIVHAQTRDDALQGLQRALADTRLDGIETNLGYLQNLSHDAVLARAEVTTRYLDTFACTPARIDVIKPGTFTTVQDWPGRTGYWAVGVPPSGPFDSLSFRLANRLLGNANDAAGLEITLQGPELLFSTATRVVIGGAELAITLDWHAQPMWQVIGIEPGQTLHLGRVGPTGARAYLCVAGGIQCPAYLGSRATFTLGRFGGRTGRALASGDVLHLSAPTTSTASANSATAATIGKAPARHTDHPALVAESPGTRLPDAARPTIGNRWHLHVLYGPHGAPDFFTQADIGTLFSTDWEVHYNSSRTGIRLIGPTPEWARSDGGEAGLHPSNIHDNAYAFGTVDFTGDMPVILGPDGPSLGGFVCPATTITADLWKLGQLRAGDRLRLVPVALRDALARDVVQQRLIDTLQPVEQPIQVAHPNRPATPVLESPVVAHRSAAENAGVEVVYRMAGDRFVLIEYGKPVLDLPVRFRVHGLMEALEHAPPGGLTELTPGIRSLQVHYDPHRLPLTQLLEHLQRVESSLNQSLATAEVPSRVVHLPLSWDDEACREAIEKYHQSVRKNAPWYPSNLEFIRRINGLDSIEDVKRIVFDAAYLVMGLGDVYLGAPVATPVNPMHRLVTTKYNPARTWTAENSVGIGGSYLCVYGMEGPGGYQFVGRTLQMWNRHVGQAGQWDHSDTGSGADKGDLPGQRDGNAPAEMFDKPWLLRFFDQIHFFEVSHEELMQIRRDFPKGAYPLRIEHTTLSLSDYRHRLDGHARAIEAFRDKRERAFSDELARWHASGQFNVNAEEPVVEPETRPWPADSITLDSPVAGSVWQLRVEPGVPVRPGQTLMILESMKMEINLDAPDALRIAQVLVKPGERVRAGQTLLVFEEPDT